MFKEIKLVNVKRKNIKNRNKFANTVVQQPWDTCFLRWVTSIIQHQILDGYIEANSSK